MDRVGEEGPQREVTPQPRPKARGGSARAGGGQEECPRSRAVARFAEAEHGAGSGRAEQAGPGAAWGESACDGRGQQG